jgi:predicted GNAT superfamily acetyltransferase
MNIRPYQPADLAALHAINCASEPGVGAVTAARLGQIIAQGACHVAEEDGTAIGFLLTLAPGADYDSQNYQWFDARYESYVYVDRIAIAPQARGNGLGAALYADGFSRFAGTALLMGCEVHLAPPNPRSMAFHARLGFGEVGRARYRDDYQVAFLARRLGT